MERTAALLAAVIIGSSTAEAQPAEPPRIVIPRVARAPQRADFESMEIADAPLGMRRVEGFVQRFPNDGEAVSERTVAYIGYDQEFLYVVFLCFDRHVDRIGSHMLPRDAFPNDEDTVAVHIDTFRDLKHAYGFQVNAFGVQTEGTYTEGQGWDLSWDTVWRSEATPTRNGYVALFKIPFKSLRFPATDTQQWGIFFYRAIARKNEQVYWPACSTRVAARFRQAAVADGIEHVSPGRNLQAIPYVAARSFRTLDASAGGGPSFVSKSADAAIGIDGKAVVASAGPKPELRSAVHVFDDAWNGDLFRRELQPGRHRSAARRRAGRPAAIADPSQHRLAGFHEGVVSVQAVKLMSKDEGAPPINVARESATATRRIRVEMRV